VRDIDPLTLLQVCRLTPNMLKFEADGAKLNNMTRKEKDSMTYLKTWHDEMS